MSIEPAQKIDREVAAVRISYLTIELRKIVEDSTADPINPDDILYVADQLDAVAEAVLEEK